MSSKIRKAASTNQGPRVTKWQDQAPAKGRHAWVTHAIEEIQAGRGVKTHFRLLFHAYEPKCRRLLGSLVPECEVDDLVQDTMLRVYRGIGTFRLDASFDSWLQRIVKNVAKNAHRHRKTGKHAATSTSLDSMLHSDLDAGPALSEPKAPEPDPLDETLATERARHLETALEELPSRMRQCVSLHHFHGYKYREIADLQGVSVATVKKQVIEGRKRLRPALSAVAKLFGLFLVLLASVV